MSRLAIAEGLPVSVEQNLERLGVVVPQPSSPLGSYCPAVEAGSLLFISGQGPIRDGAVVYTGKVGSARTLEEGRAAARLSALNCLSVLRSATGDLGRVQRIVKVTGWVNSAAGFTDQALVMDGASRLLEEAFGAIGVHARTSVGATDLPFNVSVEVELVASVRRSQRG